MWMNYIFFINIIITLYKNIKSNDSNKYIILPFRTERPKITKDNFLSVYLSNEIFTDIEIGTPIQKIPININFENYPFFISGSELKNLPNIFFNESKSLTYKKNSTYSYEISHYLFEKGYFSNDTIILNNNKINELIFILASKESYDIKYSGQIGLRLSSNTKENNQKITNYHFINILKKYNLISNYDFTIIYKNEFEGNLIIGKRLDEIYKENYNYENYIKTIGSPRSFEIRWHIIFDNFYYKNYSNQSIEVDIYIENGLIQCPDSIFDSFINNIFKNDIDNKICDIKEFYFTRFIICNFNFDILKVGNFSFEIKDINYNFTFMPQNLFYNINEIGKLFVFSNRKLSNHWRFGKPFFQTFNITFNKDRKIIGLYKQYGGINKGNQLNWYNVILIIICIILIIFIGYLLFLYSKINKKNKIKAQELNEEYNQLY